MPCWTTIDARVGPTNTMPSQRTCRMTFFKIPPRSRTKDKLLEMYKAMPQKALNVRPSQAKIKSRVIPLPFPPLLPSLPGASQITPSFSAPSLSTGWLPIHRVGESRQDVCRPARTRIYQLQSCRRLLARRTLSTTTHRARRTRNSKRSRAVFAREI
jgi:hypothetical protein